MDERFPHALYNKLKILVSSMLPVDCAAARCADVRDKKNGNACAFPFPCIPEL
jgi:hypothetical protein